MHKDMDINPDLWPFFKSVLDQDPAPVVLCDLSHTVIYMNRTAIDRYAFRGGAALVGKSLLLCHNQDSRVLIEKTLAWFAADRSHNIVYESRNEKENKDVYIAALRNDEGQLIGYYEKHEYRNHETARFYDFAD